MQKNKRSSLVLAGGLLAGVLFAAAPAMAGPSSTMLADTCAGCHGYDGVSAGPAMPTVAGQPAGYAKEVLIGFKSGERSATIMDRIAKGYSDDELGVIADFYAKKKWADASNHENSKMATPVDPKLAAAGKKLVKKCNKCHEDEGRSTVDDMPRIAGQWLDYLLIKFQDYKNPESKSPMPKKMKKQVAKLSEADLAAIAHYYASVK